MSAQGIDQRVIALPAVPRDDPGSVDDALRRRRSVRTYSTGSLTLDQVSQLLWAGQGITGPDGLRTAPSAGALYPLEMYLVVGAVDGLSNGVYHYRPERHDLVLQQPEDRRAALARAAVRQVWMADAPAVVVIAAEYQRTTVKYGQRGIRYVHMEVGHAAQNIYLEAVALDLGTVFVGAFDDDRVHAALNLPAEHRPLGLMPVGRLP
ncbi:MAG: SagB/ThcOx family dehydrogenase [Gemmatimonadales bacterium]|nr:SagB/ThcOx family dehydrogenase [Gemmatimonadales bacterium]